MWYREADYETIPAYNRSFAVTLANLVKHLDGGDYEPSAIHNLLTSGEQYPSYATLPKYIESVSLGEVHEDDSNFPTVGPAIVKYKRVNDEDGGLIDHYCLVIDARQRSIVDSLDGIIKHGASYGQVYSWATYLKVEIPEIVENKKDQRVDGGYHIWKKGDSLVDLAREMHVSYDKLLAYNEIEEYQELEDGIPIYYPAAPISTARKIKVEIKEPVLYMHVNKPGGAKKWMFGSMSTFDDALPFGFYPEKTNVKIAAIATVPVTDEDGKDAEAAYYLDRNALGDYETSGILRYSLGFAWSDLGSGHVETVLVKATPAPEPPETPVLHTVTEIPDEEPTALPAASKDPKTVYIQEILTGYQTLSEPRECISVLPYDDSVHTDPQTGKRYIYVKDFAGKRKDMVLYDLYDITIGATFPSGGVMYGQPAESMEDKVFFGIPLSVLQSQDEMYNTDVDTQTRAENGFYLTWSERYVWIPVNKWLSRYVPGYIKNITRKK